MDGGPRWGRAAVSRFTKSAEEIQAEIIKSLEGKLSVEFKDYSQWQRIAVQPKPPPPVEKPKKKKRIKKEERPLTVRFQEGFETIKDELQEKMRQSMEKILSGTAVSGTSCSTLCLHPWNKQPPPKDDTAEILSRERCGILQAQIDAKKKSLTMYKELQSKISTENMQLRDEMEALSKNSHLAVTQYLEQYEKYSVAAKTLRRRHFDETHVATFESRVLKSKLENEIKDLKAETVTLDCQLRFLHKDLQVLRTYKDKEYPVKAMQIAKLRTKLADVRVEHHNHDAELDRIIGGQRGQLYAGHTEKVSQIIEGAADEAFNTLVPGQVVNMSWHNTILEDDIASHLRGISQLQHDIAILQSEVNALKKLPEVHAKKFVFPEIFNSQKKCSPDEDVVLDIPTLQMLPI